MNTLIVYPDAGTGGTTMDGYTSYNSATSLLFSEIRTTEGTYKNDTSTPTYCRIATSSSDYWKFIQLYRDGFTFYTAAIAGGTVSSAKLSLYGTDLYNNFSTTTDLRIVSFNPVSNNELVVADYDLARYGSTSFGSYAYSSYSTTAYNDLSLNAEGVANIATKGITKMAARLGWDVDNSSPSWEYNKALHFVFSSSDETGTTQDPKLTIEYEEAPTSDALFFGGDM